jgi:hypothetical protein
MSTLCNVTYLSTHYVNEIELMISLQDMYAQSRSESWLINSTMSTDPEDDLNWDDITLVGS